MRLVACAFSAVLLSGCSWLGFDNSSYYGGKAPAVDNGRYASQGGNNYQRQQQRQPRMGACQISSPTQRIPQGCSPEQVTLATTGAQAGYGQQAQYTSGGYGSHAQNARTQGQHQAVKRGYTKPKLRGSLGLEIDHSVSGNLYDPGLSAAVAGYNRASYAEGFTAGSVASGTVENTLYSSVSERIESPTISFDDVYTAPFRVTGGLEYIFNNHTTAFANAGYTRAEGKKGGGVAIIDELRRTTSTSTFVTDPANGTVGALLGTTTNVSFIPNQKVAEFNYEFNDMERIDMEVGMRHYFNSLESASAGRTITPFVSASAGAAHYSETSVAENQKQLFIQRAYDSAGATSDFYDVNFGNTVQIYDAQWVPYGSVKGGMEWQLTPKTALALEAGLKYEGKRDFSNGTEGDAIISVPVAIRGSFNF